MDSRPVYIYALVDPRVQGIRRYRYVGKTNDPARRLRDHINSVRDGSETNRRKITWMQRLFTLGLLPAIEVLETATNGNWQDAERRVIADLRSRNGRLVNASPGGDGVDLPRTPEWQAKIAAGRRGKAMPESAKETLRQKNLARHDAGCKNGHPWTEENTKYAALRKRNGDPRVARVCRICEKAKSDRYRLKHGQQVGIGRGNRILQITCKRGHPYDGPNTYVSPNGGRYCRVCMLVRCREYKRKIRAAQRALRPFRQTSLPFPD